MDIANKNGGVAKLDYFESDVTASFDDKAKAMQSLKELQARLQQEKVILPSQ